MKKRAQIDEPDAGAGTNVGDVEVWRGGGNGGVEEVAEVLGPEVMLKVESARGLSEWWEGMLDGE